MDGLYNSPFYIVFTISRARRDRQCTEQCTLQMSWTETHLSCFKVNNLGFPADIQHDFVEILLKGYFALSLWKEYINQLPWGTNEPVFRSSEEKLYLFFPGKKAASGFVLDGEKNRETYATLRRCHVFAYINIFLPYYSFKTTDTQGMNVLCWSQTKISWFPVMDKAEASPWRCKCDIL